MKSFDAINYSIRPSKTIQRQIVFAGIRRLIDCMGLSQLVYVGLGSIWFTDFQMAHTVLSIDDMISIESDSIGYTRACFNKPYATVTVREGPSSHVLPQLYQDPSLSFRPWLIWLDYDCEFNESVRTDVRSVIENAPGNSIFLVTFDGKEERYGAPKDRVDRIRSLFGAVVPHDFNRSEIVTPIIQDKLAMFAEGMMSSIATSMARPGGFVPTVRLVYKDSAEMVTVGGVLPQNDLRSAVSKAVRIPDWRCKPPRPIIAPPLTIREAVTLRAQLPTSQTLSRRDVQALQFDLEDAQLATFVDYYREYPLFAQVMT